MGKLFRSFGLLLALLFTGAVFAQQHYILELSRISGQRTFKQISFVNGASVEQLIPEPRVAPGDILTFRYTDFNELIYGLELEQKLETKPQQSVIATLLKSDVFSKLHFTGALGMLTDLVKSPPEDLDGRASAEANFSALATRFRSVLTDISAAQDSLNSIFEEGLTLETIRRRVDRAENRYNPDSIGRILNSLVGDAEALEGEKLTPAQYRFLKNLKTLADAKSTSYLDAEVNFKTVYELLRRIDFVTERTMIIGSNTESSNRVYTKYKLYLFIYKRADPIVDIKELAQLKRPYDYDYEGKRNGDVIRQTLFLELQVKNKPRPSWQIGINGLTASRNYSLYSLNYNSSIDSTTIRSERNTSARILISTDLSMELTSKSKNLIPAAFVGIAYAIPVKNVTATEQAKIGRSAFYLTTGLSAGFVKFPLLSLRAGVAWSRAKTLRDAYRTNTPYKGSADAVSADAFSDKIRGELFFGVGLKL